MATLTSLRLSLRNDLQDTGSVTWTDALLERAVLRAVGEFGAVSPILASVTQAATTALRRYDVAATAGLLFIEAIEHPPDANPPTYLPFREESRGIFSILGDVLPATSETFKIWFAKAHTVDGSGSTIPADYEELILTGAFGYALFMRAADTIGSINPSTWAPRQARDLADLRLSEFTNRLMELRKRQAGPTWGISWGAKPASWDTV